MCHPSYGGYRLIPAARPRGGIEVIPMKTNIVVVALPRQPGELVRQLTTNRRYSGRPCIFETPGQASMSEHQDIIDVWGRGCSLPDTKG